MFDYVWTSIMIGTSNGQLWQFNPDIVANYKGSRFNDSRVFALFLLELVPSGDRASALEWSCRVDRRRSRTLVMPVTFGRWELSRTDWCGIIRVVACSNVLVSKNQKRAEVEFRNSYLWLGVFTSCAPLFGFPQTCSIAKSL